MLKAAVWAVILAATANFQGQSDLNQSAGCKPEIVPNSKSAHSQPKAQSSFVGYKRAPIISFEVNESGKVTNTKIKRSSGSVPADEYALAEVRGWTYKSRHGCGIVGTDATVVIDFSPSPTS